ncbi:MAG: helix-turn-helix domain-containing protein [Rhodococcus sp. (in: high G+C Gram-positive bacteria)]
MQWAPSGARVGVSQSTASQYMAVLQRAHLVISTKIGPWVHYELNADYLDRLAETIKTDL